jgi:excisionase family DNA binding protein
VDSLLVTIPEAATLLSLSRSKTYQLVTSGDLPAVHIGRSARIRRVDLTTWIDAQVAQHEDLARDIAPSVGRDWR